MSIESAFPAGIDFRQCPDCAGYGVRDSGKNCTTCGGKGRGGLSGNPGAEIGSGEIMVCKATGRRITTKEFVKAIRRDPAATEGK